MCVKDFFLFSASILLTGIFLRLECISFCHRYYLAYEKIPRHKPRDLFLLSAFLYLRNTSSLYFGKYHSLSSTNNSSLST
jgi:hypothetical protein